MLVRNCRRFGTETCSQAFSSAPCVGRSGRQLTLNRTYPHGYRKTHLPFGTTVMAAGAVFLSLPRVMPLELTGGPDICVGGGQVLGQFPRDSSWTYMHGSCCNFAGVEIAAPAPLIEGIRIDNVEDGVRLDPPADEFTIHAVHLSHVFDDAIDDHECLSGTIDDVLSDGSYVGISSRPNRRQDGRGKLLTVRNSLFRLETTDQPYPTETPPAHGALFKWDPKAVDLALHGNVFLVVHSRSELGIPAEANVTSCSNNTLVWLGEGNFPGLLGRDPASGQPCLTVTTNRQIWDDAVAAWTIRHPGQ
jgi:hypothetical protein